MKPIDKFNDYVVSQLQKSYKRGTGYSYEISIKQGNKRKANKKMFLGKYRNNKGKLQTYSIDNAYWITVNVIQRMKSFWGFHKGKCRILIKPIKHKR